jgi:hypothetical protein
MKIPKDWHRVEIVDPKLIYCKFVFIYDDYELSQLATDWLETHCTGNYLFVEETKAFSVRFELPEEAMHFKLRFG